VQWTYCEQWNHVLNKPLTPFDEIEARRRHESGDLYTAASESPDQTRILVHVRFENKYVGVKFLDSRGRDNLIYVFREIDARLFLTEVVSYTYGDEIGAKGRVPLIVESYRYSPDGVCRRRVDDSRVETIDAEDRHSVDVSTHWEDIPQFGEYDAVAKYNRD
jgi:hypothetical protein